MAKKDIWSLFGEEQDREEYYENYDIDDFRNWFSRAGIYQGFMDSFAEEYSNDLSFDISTRGEFVYVRIQGSGLDKILEDVEYGKYRYISVDKENMKKFPNMGLFLEINGKQIKRDLINFQHELYDNIFDYCSYKYYNVYVHTDGSVLFGSWDNGNFQRKITWKGWFRNQIRGNLTIKVYDDSVENCYSYEFEINFKDLLVIKK